MSEREKYNPENTDYGTKHDGEFIFPDYIEEALRQYIHKHLEEYYGRNVAERKIILPLSSDVIKEEDHWYEQAKLIYTELLKQHSASFSSYITQIGEDLNLKETFKRLDKSMPKDANQGSETPPKKQVGN